MFRLALMLSLAFALFHSGVAAAKPVKKVGAPNKSVALKFGDKWGSKKTVQYEARMTVFPDGDWSSPEKYLRQPFFDEQRSRFRGTRFPLTRKQAQGMVFFDADLAVDGTGKVTTCQAMTASVYAEHTDIAKPHFCQFMLTQGYFHLPLDTSGKPISFQGKFAISYSADTRTYMIVSTGPDGKVQKNQREAGPLEPITIQSLGLEGESAVKKGASAGYSVQLDRKGKALSCTLYTPTFIDSVDAQICPRVLKMTFVSQKDHEGRDVDGYYYGELAF